MQNLRDDSLYSNEPTQKQQERRQRTQERLAEKREQQRLAEEAAKQRDAVFKKYLKIVVIVLIVVLLLFGRLVLQISNLKEQKRQAEEKLGEANSKIEELQKTLENVTAPEYIEHMARSLLRMIYPEEVLYIIEDE